MNINSNKPFGKLAAVLVGVGTLISTLNVGAQIIAGGPAQTNKSVASTTVTNQNVDASIVTEFEQARQTFKDFRVESVEEFIKIKNYHEQLLSEGKITHKFRTADGHLVHCIEIGSQESIKRAGIDPKSIRFAPEIPPPGSQNANNENMANPADFGMDGSLDPDGNVRKCPSGSIPVLIPSLESLCGFKKLEDRFRKWPLNTNAAPAVITNRIHGGVAPLESTGIDPPSLYGHEYARAKVSVENQGAQADFNVWQPAVTGIEEFSLSQLWVSSGNLGPGLQTVETGWQVFPDKYLDSQPHFFVYYTTDNYSAGSSYYNLDLGTKFVQTSSSVIVGASISPISTIGGSQYEVTLMFYRDQGGNHDWWLKYGDTWVGYYPNSIFNSSGIADESVYIVFGGEILNNNFLGVHTTTQMGSGQFPSGGWQHAAFVKRIKYYDINYNFLDANNLLPEATDSSGQPNFGYYDVAVGSSSDPNWGQYIYFGGPGYVGVNDVCSGAIALNDNVYYEQNTSNAADDSGPCSGTLSKGVWFTFTPSVTGTATVDTCPSDFDTKIEIFGGACGALSSIACNDDNGSSCSGTRASASFSCVAGTTYHICVGGSGGASGNLQVRAHAFVSPPPQLLVSPSSGFSSSGSQGGPFSPGSQQYSLSNAGGGTLNWTASADQNWVTVSQSSGQNSGTVTVSINSNANSLNNGTYYSTVTFGGNGGTITEQVKLTVANILKIISLNGNLAFGNVTVGTSAQSTLTISNSGNATLTVSGISYPSGFSGSWSGTIPAGGSHNVTVTFAPTSATSYGGTVTVNSDATGGNNTISASGTGTTAATRIISVTGNLNFGNVQEGTTAQRTFTIWSEGGNANLDVSNITYPSGFSGAWSGTLLLGGSANVTVTFSPTIIGSYGGTVRVNSDATSGVNTIAASGAGIITQPPPVSPFQIPPFAVLHTFTGGNDGGCPAAGLVQGSDGNFYGTTCYYGQYGWGTIFQITPSGSNQTLYPFPTIGSTGGRPMAPLIQGNDGNFYGTTKFGGANAQGSVFNMTSEGKVTTLYSFTSGSDGCQPMAPLIQAIDGNYYGTTSGGGYGCGGTAFKITSSGTFTLLNDFDCSISGVASHPSAPLIQGEDGNFYGTARCCDWTAYNSGNIFKMNSSGVLTNLHSFTDGADGGRPGAGLVLASDGNFYGGTSQGGAYGYGTIFRVTTNGTLTVLHAFTGGTDGDPGAGIAGNYPLAPLIQATDGNLYGTTYGGGAFSDGTVFQITTNGVFTTLHSFSGADGANPLGGLVQGKDGNLYGATYTAANGAGVVFRLVIPLGLQSVTQTGNAITLTWGSIVGQTYQAQYNSDLSSTNWLNLTSLITATSSTTTVSDTILPNQQRYYRIVLFPEAW